MNNEKSRTNESLSSELTRLGYRFVDLAELDRPRAPKTANSEDER